jgi:hypothetical protein
MDSVRISDRYVGLQRDVVKLACREKEMRKRKREEAEVVDRVRIERKRKERGRVSRNERRCRFIDLRYILYGACTVLACRQTIDLHQGRRDNRL